MEHPPSFSADPAVHDTSKIKKKITKKTPIQEFRFAPYKPRTNEKIFIADKRFQPKVDFSKIVFKPGPFFDVFDAKNPPKGAIPQDFEKDPSLLRRLTKCATLAIGDYNSQTKSDYRFVNIEMATWQLFNGSAYNITFQARNAMDNYETFEATVFNNSRVREVMQIRMKGSDWYDGTLSELVN